MPLHKHRPLPPPQTRKPAPGAAKLERGGDWKAVATDGDGSGAPPPFNGAAAYSSDKRRQVAQAEALARRWAPRGVCVVSMHPGWAATEGVAKSLPAFNERMAGSLRTPAQGADTIVWLALEV